MSKQDEYVHPHNDDLPEPQAEQPPPADQTDTTPGANKSGHTQVKNQSAAYDAAKQTIVEKSVSDSVPTNIQPPGAPTTEDSPPASEGTLTDDFPSDATAIGQTRIAPPSAGSDNQADAGPTDAQETLIDADSIKDADPHQTIVEESLDNPDTGPATNAPTRQASAPGRGGDNIATTPGSKSTSWKTTVGRTGAGQAGDGVNITGADPNGPQRYQLIDNFARGGLGNIWRAQDVSIRREVAYKELLPKALHNASVTERFLEEAQVTGQLEHPGIVPIYDLGYQKNGTPYYAMKLVHGETLEKAIDVCHSLPDESSGQTLAFTKLLGCFVDICNAIAFAHDRGVLHRDLKPLNIMVGDFGETIVLDWGLAKLIGTQDPNDLEPAFGDGDNVSDGTQQTGIISVDDATIVEGTVTGAATAVGPGATSGGTGPTAGGSTEMATSAGRSRMGNSTIGTYQRQTVSTDVRSRGSQTIMGSVMGTPAYMPPEQALGQLDEIDPRSDIYALGAILYKILTNRPPIPKGKMSVVLKQVKEGRIVPPREHNAKVPKPLEAVCLKALSKKKADRYSSALTLAADVQAHLADEPVSVYEDPWRKKIERWAKRHRRLVDTSGAAAIAMLTAGFFWWWVQGQRIENIRSSAASRVAKAKVDIGNKNFSGAKSLLTQALGIVEPESKLAPLRTDIQNQIDGVNRSIGAAAEFKIQQALKIQQANTEIPVYGDYQKARMLLEKAVASLEDVPDLAELKVDAGKRLDEINAKIQLQDAVAVAKNSLEEFQVKVVQARFYGSLFTGENVDEDCREAQRHAINALKTYGLDEADGLQATPEHLTENLRWVKAYRSQTGQWPVDTIRGNAFELMLTMAETQVTLARNGSVEQQRVAASEALAWLNKAEALGIKSPAAYRYKAKYLQTLDLQPARDEALAAADATPAKTALDFFLLAEPLRKAQKYQDALLLYQEALRIDADDFWSLNMMGLCHLQDLRPAAAVASYTACIAQRSDFPWPYLTRGFAYAELKQFDNAHKDFAKAIELDANLYNIYLNRGAVYVVQQRYNEAIADFQHAAGLRAQIAAPHINLAETYRRQAISFIENEDPFKAQPLFENALEKLNQAAALNQVSNNPNIYRMRADIHLRLDDIAAAQRDFKRHIELERFAERTAESYKQLGLIEHRENQFEAALTSYDQSLDINPTDTETIRLRAEALLALKRDKEAIADYSKFLQLTNSKYLEQADSAVGVYVARGLARARSGQYRGAVNDYTLSLAFEPAPNILARRGWAYLLEANKLALQDFEEAVKLNPQNSDSYAGRGYAKVMLGDFDGATADADLSLDWARKQAATQGSKTWPLFYNTSNIFAQAVDRVSKDDSLTPGKKEELAKKYTGRAMLLISEALKVAGPKLQPAVIRYVQTDAALDPIRKRPEFQAVFKKPATPENKP